MTAARDAGSTGSSPALPAAGSTPAAAPAVGTPTTPTTAAAPAVTAMSAAPPKKAARPPAGRGSDGVLVILTVLAVLVALGATGIAIYALDQARGATTRANEAYSVADRAAHPAAPTAVALPARPPVSPSASASRGPTFVPELVRSTLRVPAADSPCASVYVNVDNMTFGSLTGHEFYLSNCVGPLSVHVDRTSGAVPTANNPTPEVCAAQITGQTSTAELVLPVIDGQTFCLLTNKADATQLGNPQRIAIVEVTDVAADNGVTFAVSTYRVPGAA